MHVLARLSIPIDSPSVSNDTRLGPLLPPLVRAGIAVACVATTADMAKYVRIHFLRIHPALELVRYRFAIFVIDLCLFRAFAAFIQELINVSHDSIACPSRFCTVCIVAVVAFLNCERCDLGT